MTEHFLEPEVMDSIEPFSGTEAPTTGAERMMLDGHALQRTQTSYTTAIAVQKSRSITRVAHNVLEEAKLAGKSFYYRWPVNNKDGSRSWVQGPSIDLTMSLARNYGNCVLDVELADENMTHFMLKGFFIDLESGFTSPRLYRQRKKQNLGGKMDKDRAEDIVFQIGQTKAIRNAINKAMPKWLVEKAIETAVKAELASIKPENLALARTKVVDFFSQYGVDQERIEATLGRPADKWTEQDIVDLRGMATALKDGSVAVDDLFPPVVEEPKQGQATTSPPPPTGEPTGDQGQDAPTDQQPGATPERMSVKAQHDKITALCKDMGKDRTGVLRKFYGKGVMNALTDSQADELIGKLKAQKKELQAPPSRAGQELLVRVTQLCGKLGLSEEDEAQSKFGKPLVDLSAQDAHDWIAEMENDLAGSDEPQKEKSQTEGYMDAVKEQGPAESLNTDKPTWPKDFLTWVELGCQDNVVDNGLARLNAMARNDKLDSQLKMDAIVNLSVNDPKAFTEMLLKYEPEV